MAKLRQLLILLAVLKVFSEVLEHQSQNCPERRVFSQNAYKCWYLLHLRPWWHSLKLIWIVVFCLKIILIWLQMLNELLQICSQVQVLLTLPSFQVLLYKVWGQVQQVAQTHNNSTPQFSMSNLACKSWVFQLTLEPLLEALMVTMAIPPPSQLLVLSSPNPCSSHSQEPQVSTQVESKALKMWPLMIFSSWLAFLS